jgi:hypothetical protein
LIFRSSKLFLSRFILVFILLLLVLSIFPASANAGYTVAQLQVTPKTGPTGGSPMADVSPGQSGTVSFDAKVILTKYRPRNEQIFVSLRAHSELEGDVWGASVSPPEILFNPQEFEKDVKIHVTAPMYEDVNEERNMIVVGTWMSSVSTISGEIKPHGVHVRVAPYIKFFTSLVDGYQRVWPGGKADFSMKIWNLGNRNESFHISVNHLDALSKAGFAVTFPTETVWVKPGDNSEFKFTVEGSVRYFHPWRTQLTAISLHVVPSNELPGQSVLNLENYAWNTEFYYYEWGPSFPVPCIAGIIIGIIILTVIYYYFKKRSGRRRKLRRAKRLRRRQRQKDADQK